MINYDMHCVGLHCLEQCSIKCDQTCLEDIALLRPPFRAVSVLLLGVILSGFWYWRQALQDMVNSGSWVDVVLRVTLQLSTVVWRVISALCHGVEAASVWLLMAMMLRAAKLAVAIWAKVSPFTNMMWDAMKAVIARSWMSILRLVAKIAIMVLDVAWKILCFPLRRFLSWQEDFLSPSELGDVLRRSDLVSVLWAEAHRELAHRAKRVESTSGELETTKCQIHDRDLQVQMLKREIAFMSQECTGAKDSNRGLKTRHRNAQEHGLKFKPKLRALCCDKQHENEEDKKTLPAVPAVLSKPPLRLGGDKRVWVRTPFLDCYGRELPMQTDFFPGIRIRRSAKVSADESPVWYILIGSSNKMASTGKTPTEIWEVPERHIFNKDSAEDPCDLCERTSVERFLTPDHMEAFCDDCADKDRHKPPIERVYLTSKWSISPTRK